MARHSPKLADVAELADAQVSEACDGDIVEVQVLSSAPKHECEPAQAARFFVCHKIPICGVLVSGARIFSLSRGELR